MSTYLLNIRIMFLLQLKLLFMKFGFHHFGFHVQLEEKNCKGVISCLFGKNIQLK